MSYKENAYALALCVAHNINLILWGNPGHGKTSVITQLARDYGFHLETIVASLRDPSDFAGVMIEKDMTTINAPPRFARACVDAAAKGVTSLVLYDEISTAAPATQASLLRVVLEKVAGDLAMPESTRSIGTANPPSIAADGWELTPPTANRFTHIDWKLSAEIVIEGFIKGHFPPISFPKMAKNTESFYRYGDRIVASFLESRPSLLDTLDYNSFGTGNSDTFRASDYAFASPRSWKTVGKIYGGYLSMRLDNGKELPIGVLRKLIEGTVGVGVGREFIGYIKELDLPDPKAILLGQVELSDPERIDKAIAILAALEHTYNSAPPQTELWNTYGNVLSRISKFGFADATHIYGNRWMKQRPQGAVPTSEHRAGLIGVIQELEAG